MNDHSVFVTVHKMDLGIFASIDVINMRHDMSDKHIRNYAICPQRNICPCLQNRVNGI